MGNEILVVMDQKMRLLLSMQRCPLLGLCRSGIGNHYTDKEEEHKL